MENTTEDSQNSQCKMTIRSSNPTSWYALEGDAESIAEEEDKVRQCDDAINRKGKVWHSMAQEGQI